jgi:acyl-CoA synthetase (NDP forming)
MRASMERTSQLDSLFFPRTLAVVGASASNAKFFGRFPQVLMDFGYKGRMFPVNRNGEEVFGLKAYRSVREIPEAVDSAVIIVPARFVPQVLEDCLEKGIAGAQIITSGFAETGEEEGIALERQLREIAARGIRLIGPNCFGIYCPRGGLTLLPGGDFPTESGPVAFLSQSGGHAVEMGRQAQGRGLRFSKVVSYGNACDINESDLLEYMAQDTETKVITMYLEGPREGRRFLEIVRETAAKKPVIIWKAGLTALGSRAVFSHTASLAGEEAIWEALFKQTAAIQVHSLEELADTAEALLTLPPSTGRRIGMIGGGGGISVTAADACASVGLDIPPFDEEVRERLAQILPPAGTATRNPVDLGAPIVPLPIFQGVLETVAGVDSVDTIIATQALFYVFRVTDVLAGMADIAQLLLEAPVAVKERYKKPVVMILPLGGEEVEMAEAETRRRKARDWYRQNGILALPTLERATRAVANVVDYYDRVGRRS